MKTIVKTLLVIALLTAAAARAEWRDLRVGLDPKAVAELVGQPLMQQRARGGVLVTWTFDHGGYVLFENGRIRYWQAPRTEKN